MNFIFCSIHIHRHKHFVIFKSASGTQFIFNEVYNCLFEIENCIETISPSFIIILLLQNQFEISDIIILFAVSLLQRIFLSLTKKTILSFQISLG